MQTTAPTKKPQKKNIQAETKTMRAAELRGPQDFHFRNTKKPQPGSNEVLIKMHGCGLCASSIPLWEGREWFDYPQQAGAPGHEGYGEIAEVGENVESLKPGDYVAAISYNAYAEYDLAPEAQVVKLPDEFRNMPFPGEPLGCAMNILERSDIKPGQTVAIVGIGFLGALLVQLAKASGAKVVAISRRDFSLQTASEQGADETIKLSDHDNIKEKVSSITNGNWCQRVIECTGAEAPLNLAGELCAVRGKLIVAGFHQGGMRQVNMQLWNWRGLDVINAHERDPQRYVEGVQKAIKAIQQGQVDPRPLFTHHFSQQEINSAHKTLTARPEGFVKAILTLQ